jgi:hypothetical protein
MSFVRAYFATNVYQLRNLPKFYANGATVTRGGDPIIYSEDRGPEEVSLPLPSHSTLTVVRYTPIRCQDVVIVNVLGVVETGASKSSFTQTFLLVEVDDRLWVKGDFFTITDDRLFESLDSDTFYPVEAEQVPPVRPTRQPAREAKPPPERQKEPHGRGERDGRSNRFVWRPPD